MKTESRNGAHYVYGDNKTKYDSAFTAMWAGAVAQIFFTQEGYLTSMTMYKDTKKVELTVHFDKFNLPCIPENIGYSQRTLNSHQYWSDYRKVNERVRTATFTFKY